MINAMQKLDTSKQLMIYRYNNGITLVKPEQKSLPYSALLGRSTAVTVADALELPFNVFFLNTQSTMLNNNEVCAEKMGFDSSQESIGKSVFDICPYNNAKQVVQNDREVIKNNKLSIIEEQAILLDGENHHFLSIKVPLYDNECKIIGIFGCSISYKDNPIAESLMKISTLGLLEASNHSLNNHIDEVRLGSTPITKRENDILYHLVRGKTAKEIAISLHLSPRTVEKHLMNVKAKMGVNRKSKLIQKVIPYFISES